MFVPEALAISTVTCDLSYLTGLYSVTREVTSYEPWSFSRTLKSTFLLSPILRSPCFASLSTSFFRMLYEEETFSDMTVFVPEALAISTVTCDLSYETGL